MAVARFGLVAVDFTISQYDDDSPRTIEFSAVVQLSESDLVAALWQQVYVTAEELADLDGVRAWVADVIVNVGLDAVDKARSEMASLTPGTAEHAWSQQIHAAVRRAFAGALSSPAPAARRELATAGQAVAR